MLRLSLVFLILAAPAHARKVDVYLSSVVEGEMRALVKQKALRLVRLGTKKIDPTFRVLPQQKFQKLDGFGANFTESCAINLLKLKPSLRREVMEKMFSKKKGAGFDYLRLPMGASDFSDGEKGSYTYNDTKDNEPDPEFKQFDLSRDEKSIELIREAMRINPNVHVMISPWTAPAWMKPNKHLHDGWLDPERYEDYGNYFIRVIRELQKRKIPVTSLTVQNEPYYTTKGYPTMYMSTKDMSRFIGDYLGPMLEMEKLPIRIFSHDHNWSLSVESNEILLSPAARKYTAGVAYHCYWGTRYNMFDTFNTYPEKSLIQTECTGSSKYLDGTKSDPLNDFEWWLDNQSIGAVRMGPTGTLGALGWNLCLDEKNGPQNGIKGDPAIPNGGCTDCRGMVQMDFSGKEPKIIYNGEFHALAQVSRFISPKTHRIGMEGEPEGLIAASFLNPGGEIVFAIHNGAQEARAFTVGEGKDVFSYELPARSAATFVWKK